MKPVVVYNHKLLKIVYKILEDKVPYDERRTLNLRHRGLISAINLCEYTSGLLYDKIAN